MKIFEKFLSGSFVVNKNRIYIRRESLRFLLEATGHVLENNSTNSNSLLDINLLSKDIIKASEIDVNFLSDIFQIKSQELPQYRKIGSNYERALKSELQKAVKVTSIKYRSNYYFLKAQVDVEKKAVTLAVMEVTIFFIKTYNNYAKPYSILKQMQIDSEIPLQSAKVFTKYCNQVIRYGISLLNQ